MVEGGLRIEQDTGRSENMKYHDKGRENRQVRQGRSRGSREEVSGRLCKRRGNCGRTGEHTPPVINLTVSQIIVLGI